MSIDGIPTGLSCLGGRPSSGTCRGWLEIQQLPCKSHHVIAGPLEGRPQLGKQPGKSCRRSYASLHTVGYES